MIAPAALYEVDNDRSALSLQALTPVNDRDVRTSVRDPLFHSSFQFTAGACLPSGPNDPGIKRAATRKWQDARRLEAPMLRYLIMVVTVSMSALGAVKFLNENPNVVETAAVVAKDQLESHAAQRTTAASRPPLSGTERLRADSRGHYVADFTFNARRVTGVVDTGATLIALNRSEARRAGINVSPNDFVYQVNTANGTALAARVVIDEVRLGTIRVHNVEAMVLEDDSLQIVLIGMSFLNRLRNFEFSNGTLQLRL
jgi:aspartyl protease family protein